MTKACVKCRIIVEKGLTCPICKGKNLTEKLRGLVVIFNPEKSKIAKEMNSQTPGEYALRIGK